MGKPELSKRLKEEIALFVENTPAQRLNRNLRKLLTSYLMVCKDGHIFNLDDLLYDITALFELLDVVEDEGGQVIP